MIDPTKTRARGRPSWSRVAAIGDYDGATDKIASSTEGEVPYAWQWYQDYTAMLGSGFSQARAGIVHARKLALARSEAARSRAAERFLANCIPETSDELLPQWAQILRISTAGQPSWLVRQKCAAKFAAVRGSSAVDVDATLTELLGSAYIQSIRLNTDPLSTPPDPTFWPGVNNGPSVYSLGGGTWFSKRAQLVVQLTRPSQADLGQFLRLVNVDLFAVLDDLLPATATFTWTIFDKASVSAGFLLDVSRLDLTGLTPS